MISSILITSLEITAIFMLFKEGMLLARLSYRYNNLVDYINKRMIDCVEARDAFPSADVSKEILRNHIMAKHQYYAFVHMILSFLRNPLFECLTCMASVWGTLFWFIQWHGGLNFDLLFFLLAVAGVNAVIDTFLGDKHLY